MQALFLILLSVALCGWLACVYFLIRNQFVYAFRMTRLKEARHCARFIITVANGYGEEYLEPYHRLEAITYEEMMYSLLPLRRFIHDTWLDDLYTKYEQIADAKRLASKRQDNVGQNILARTTDGNMEASEQGRITGDVGRGEVEQEQREANPANS